VAALSLVMTLAAMLPTTSCRRVDRAWLDIGEVVRAVRLFHDRTGVFPDPLTGFDALVDLGILDRAPKDPWGNDYRYALVDGRPVVTSLGSDGRPGGEGNAADISSSPTAFTYH
jgi:general secretion pathway protein G